MQKNIAAIAVISILIGGAGGYLIGTRSTGGGQGAPSERGMSGNFGSRTGGARTTQGGNFVTGTIVSNSNNEITIQLPEATTTDTTTGSKIVILEDSTQITKTVSGSSTDLTTGSNVVVSGTSNSDGSITASSIQIRPTSMQRFNQVNQQTQAQ